ncbi:MAG: ABC transporter ATP-binding protein [Rhodospirillales bacterium]|nr:MAG: ABC transporter ATP-binding protein [Rhodospirillales bacterium]TVR96880.1 MAG: ABC transporter ATP-binding protein [Rhodospirillales bacterium]
MSLLAVEGLAKAFGGVRAVAGIGFMVQPGEMVAIIGPNGAGKTTCFNLLGGQLRPDAGRVTFGGRNITGWAPPALARAGIGRTFQVAQVFRSMTARENVQVARAACRRRLLSLLRSLAGTDTAEADRLLDAVGLAAAADQPVTALAYADLKRLELAVALAGEPILLLMDEPTAGIAASERQALMALVRNLVAARGLSVLFTEHDMDVVFGHADRVIVMHEGALLADGAPERIRTDPRVREVYLGGSLDDVGIAAGGQA